ncbi:MAG: flagellar hook-length control protein FliK [bacterium]|nr:flagellar hook-length control protein FliK [bacterium]
MQVEQMDSFRDAMNTSYIPASLSNTGTDVSSTKDFTKEFESTVNFNDTTESDRSGRQVEKEDNPVDDKPARRTRPDAEAREAEARRGENSKRMSPGEREALAKDAAKQRAKEAPKETGNEKNAGENQKAGKGAREAAHTGKQSIKEILRKHQIQTHEINQVKEDVKDNFSEAQKLKSGNNVEKVVLKGLEGGQEASKDAGKVDGVSPNEPKNSEELNANRRQANPNDFEIEKIEKKDNPSAVKNEPKVVKNSDNGIFNVADINAGDSRSVKEIKLQKVLAQNNILEQYEALKEKVVNSVENSIKFMVNTGENRASINLHPPELGKIQVELVVTDNKVSAKINTENIAVKEVILTNLDQLKSNIENAGISVDKFDVEVGGFKNQFEGQLSGGNSNKGGGNKENHGQGDPQGNDWLPDKIIKQNALSYFIGRSINYLV